MVWLASYVKVVFALALAGTWDVSYAGCVETNFTLTLTSPGSDNFTWPIGSNATILIDFECFVQKDDYNDYDFHWSTDNTNGSLMFYVRYNTFTTELYPQHSDPSVRLVNHTFGRFKLEVIFHNVTAAHNGGRFIVLRDYPRNVYVTERRFTVFDSTVAIRRRCSQAPVIVEWVRDRVVFSRIPYTLQFRNTETNEMIKSPKVQILTSPEAKITMTEASTYQRTGLCFTKTRIAAPGLEEVIIEQFAYEEDSRIKIMTVTNFKIRQP